MTFSNNTEPLLHGVATTPDIPPYHTIALVLQGGGALGAYQAGVYEGLCEASIAPNCLSGISIGALNIAIIAGNPPETRLARLKEFWEIICQPAAAFSPLPFFEKALFNLNEMVRHATGAMGATSAMVNGQKGFFRPRFPPPSVMTGGDPRTASYYDTSDLKSTLERLCDFDLINSGQMRVSVGAVNVRTGNFAYFDNSKIKLRAEHFMASGALPPAFAAVEIDGEYYWDGGLVSNTPLAYVLDNHAAGDALAFQVDLWSARGRPPVNMSEVSDRMKEIQYSSRTRLITDHLHKLQEMRHTMFQMLDDLPAKLRATKRYKDLERELSDHKRYNIVHLIYRDQPYDQHYKDYQFSHEIMLKHWAGGLDDIRQTLKNPAYLAIPDNHAGFVTHDIHREEIELAMQL